MVGHINTNYSLHTEGYLFKWQQVFMCIIRHHENTVVQELVSMLKVISWWSKFVK